MTSFSLPWASREEVKAMFPAGIPQGYRVILHQEPLPEEFDPEPWPEYFDDDDYTSHPDDPDLPF